MPFLAPILVLTLLVCHGSLGGTHRLVLEPALPAEAEAVAGHSASHSSGHSAEDHPAPPVDVAAALFLVLLGYALRALLRSSRGGCAQPGTAPPGFARAHPLVARPPTPPLLQVFRL